MYMIKPAKVNKYVYVCICTYMMVYVCICMYKFVYSYMYVFPGMTSSDTGTDATSPKNTLRGRQSAGHTQGTPGHLSIHFFLPSANLVQRLCRPDLAHPTPRHASWATEAPLSFRTEVSNARSAHYNPFPWPGTADLAGWSPSRCPRASAAPPRKHLSTAIRQCM